MFSNLSASLSDILYIVTKLTVQQVYEKKRQKANA